MLEYNFLLLHAEFIKVAKMVVSVCCPEMTLCGAAVWEKTQNRGRRVSGGHGPAFQNLAHHQAALWWVEREFHLNV